MQSRPCLAQALRSTAVAAALLLVGSAAVAAPPQAAAVQAAQKAAAEAKAAYLARDYDKAAAQYAEALKNFEHPNLFFTYARSLEQLGQFKTAAFAFERAAKLTNPGPERNTMAARGAANIQLDEAQQQLSDGQAAAALPLIRAAHLVLLGQSKRAEDGQVYPEPAAALLLFARIELALGNAGHAAELLAEVQADPTAPQKLIDRAGQLAGQQPAGPRAKPAEVAAKSAVAQPVEEPVVAKPVVAQAPAKPAVTPGEAERGPVESVQAPAPAERPLGAWIALGGSTVLTLAGAVWWAATASEVAELQTKLDSATAAKTPVAGMSQQDYEAAKVRLDNATLASSALMIGGGVAMAASAAWWWWGGRAPRKVVVVPAAQGMQMVVAW